MDLLSPGTGLIIWQLFVVAGTLLFITAWIVILRSRHLDATTKLYWMLGTMFLPVIGAVLFFLSHSTLKKEGKQ